MRHKSKQKKTFGFSLPVVIFILVVISVLAGAMARLMGGSGLSTAFEVQSTRAYLASRSGLEWAANATLTNSMNPDCPPSLPYPTNSSASPTQIDFNEPGLYECTTLLSCARISPNTLQRHDNICNQQHYSGNCTVSLFLLSSNATCGTGPAQAQRNLQWLVGKETRYP